MPLPSYIFAVLGTLLLVQSLFSLLDGYRFRRFVRSSLGRPPSPFHPPVALIIPCKGWMPAFDANLACFLDQDYPALQIILAVASADDAAYPVLAARAAEALETGAQNRKTVSLVVAGYSDERGDKVTNLLRGVGAVRAGTEVLAFADMDARVRPDWLRRLVAPLADRRVTVSTGFRWYLPGRTLASRLRAAWDASVATLLGERSTLAWGGSMAIRAADFENLRIRERYWTHTVSDDYALRRAVRESGGAIRFEPQCLVESREESTLGEFLRWANRQIILTRVYAAPLWLAGLLSYLLYAVTFLVGIVSLLVPGLPAAFRLAAAATLLVVLLLGILKGRVRTQVARELFPGQAATGHGTACYWQLASLVPWIMLINFVTAGLTRRIEWAGVEYELGSPDGVRVLRRHDESNGGRPKTRKE